MASYVVPQVEIHQLFGEIPNEIAQQQVPFVFGPNYHLHRYSDASEKVETLVGTWLGDNTYGEQAENATYTVLSTFTDVALDNSDSEGKTLTITKTAGELFTDLFIGRMFRVKNVTGEGPEREETVIAVAQILKLTISKDNTTATVVLNKSLTGKDFTLGEVVELTGNFYEYPGALDEELVDKSYTKLIGDNVYVALGKYAKVNKVDGDLSLLDITVGKDEPAAEEVLVGRMLRLAKAEATSNISAVKDVKIIKVVKITTTAEQTTVRVEIDEEIDTELAFDCAFLCELQNGVEFNRKDFTDETKSLFFWEEAEETTSTGGKIYGVKVNRLAAYLVDSDYTGKWGWVLSADLYLTYRELITSSSDTIHAITSTTEVADVLGTISPDNPLAQAVYNAALNAGGQTIRYMAVPTADLSLRKNDEDADLEGYTTVLAAAELTKDVYFLVPVTRDRGILQLVKSHVESMSAATTKRWRIAFISDEIPETDPLYTSANNPDGDDFYAIVKSTAGKGLDKTADIWFYDEIDGADGIKTYRESEYTAFKKYVKKDDLVYINWIEEWGVKTPRVVKVVKVLNNNRLRVADPDDVLQPSENVAGGFEVTAFTNEAGYSKAEVYHPYTKTETAELIKKRSSYWGSRRIYNIFPSVYLNNGVQYTGEFAAACVAGLVSSCLPQQPVTNLQLNGIDDVPLVYQTFNLTELNTIASGGTFILMQDSANDEVYVRHQISTAYEDNNLNTSELSITKNVDSISYTLDTVLSPYIGKYNITPELLTTLHSVITSTLVRLGSDSYGLYGSQIILDGTEILLLEQDALLKDHVNCNIKLNVPYPFNHLVLKLFV